MVDNAANQIHDIVAAPPATWWPLAPGWYVLAVLTFVLMVSAVLLFIRRHRTRKIRNAAINRVSQHNDINALNLLLKQACYGYFSKDKIAALSGQKWHQFLLSQLPEQQRARFVDLLVESEAAAYQAGEPNYQLVSQYQAFTRLWLRTALPPRGKAQRSEAK